MSRSDGHGCTIMAACTPAKAPRSSISTLPPPPSSAGVPSTRTVSPDVVGDRGQGQAGADGGGGDDVVPAGVTDVGQRVVLGAHRHHELPVAGAGLESRRQVVHAFIHRQPARPHGLGHRVGRRRLLEAELRVAWRRWLSETSSSRLRSTTLAAAALAAEESSPAVTAGSPARHLLYDRHDVAGADRVARARRAPP